MSKSPNLFLPALGGAALVLGGAYGIATNIYANDKISSMENTVAQMQTKADEAGEAANAEVARAAELEAKAIEIQNEAKRQLASAGGGPIREPAPEATDGYGLGREALPEEIAAWDVDVLPDGRGLPEGSGDVMTGDEVFQEKCASCHGSFAEGLDNWPKLAGGQDTLADKDPVKTVGSYWPYLSTVWDYVHRSMPFGAAQTVTADETYAIVAYILYSNDLVDDDFVLSNENFLEVEMYNAEGFIVDDREETEYPNWRTEPCMENCKENVEITMRASVLDVTPDDGTDMAAEPEHASAEGSEDVEMAEAAPSDETEASDDAAEGPDPELVAAGEQLFKKCQACHQVGDGAKNRVGPQLNGVMGRTIGGVEDFKYSNVFQTAAEEGRTWDDESMSAFLADPKGYMKGTKMSFAGFKKDEELNAIIAYLQSASE